MNWRMSTGSLLLLAVTFLVTIALTASLSKAHAGAWIQVLMIAIGVISAALLLTDPPVRADSERDLDEVGAYLEDSSKAVICVPKDAPESKRYASYLRGVGILRKERGGLLVDQLTLKLKAARKMRDLRERKVG